MDDKNAAVLKKILQHTSSIMKYCGGCHSREDFERDPMRVEATVFNLMQIGELAKESLDDETKLKIKTIPWHQIYGLRNRIVHGYSGVNMRIVYACADYIIVRGTTSSCTTYNFSAILKRELARYIEATTGERKPAGNTKKEITTMTNIEKALALINSFATGDTSVADSILADGYIQHNLAFGTGKAAFIAAVEGLNAAPAKTTVNNIRAFSDGDKVFLQTVYDFAGAGEQVAFDVFRFDADGKIAEHWDNLTAKAAPNPSGHTQIDGTLEKKDADKEETRRVVSGFVGDVLRGEHPEKLASYYDGDKYIQHNTGIADGLSGLGAALEALGKQGITMVYNKTHFVLADGDYALAASEGTFGGVPTTYYDLFRVENGYIAEHWDVMETLADKSTWQNQNGKF